MRGGQQMGSRGSDIKLPSVPNKVAMGGMRGLPGMPGSKGLESRGAGSKGGNKPPMGGPGAFRSNQGAGYNLTKPTGNNYSGPGGLSSNLNAFNVIGKYGAGSGIGGGIGGGMGLGSYSGGLGDPTSGSAFGAGGDRMGSSASRRAGSRRGSNSGLGRHKY